MLSVLENWLYFCLSCVKLGSAMSYFLGQRYHVIIRLPYGVSRPSVVYLSVCRL